MLILGITGGVGMGKSTSARFLEQMGICVTDTDRIAHELTAKGQPVLDHVRASFGATMFGPDGALDRTRLADLVFADPGARALLESILHPRIRAKWQERVAAWRTEGQACGAVVIPLLFETGAEGLFDAILCVACTAATQSRRLIERGWTEAHVRARVGAQLPIELKIHRSDFMIWTEPPVAVHEDQVQRILFTLGFEATVPAH